MSKAMKALEHLRAQYGKPGWEWLSVDYLNGFEAATDMASSDQLIEAAVTWYLVGEGPWSTDPQEANEQDKRNDQALLELERAVREYLDD